MTNQIETDRFSFEQEKFEMMHNVTFISLSGGTEYLDMFECGISLWQHVCRAVILHHRDKGDSYLYILFNLQNKHCLLLSFLESQIHASYIVAFEEEYARCRCCKGIICCPFPNFCGFPQRVKGNFRDCHPLPSVLILDIVVQIFVLYMQTICASGRKSINTISQYRPQMLKFQDTAKVRTLTNHFVIIVCVFLSGCHYKSLNNN